MAGLKIIICREDKMEENVSNQSHKSNLGPNQKSILCIEDELFIGDLYRHAFEKAGYKFDLVVSGDNGLDMAKQNNYDFILLDIVIPGMLGVEILHELRKLPDLSSKVIITTNLEQDQETRSMVEKEADAYLIKAEITPNQLVEFIDNFN